MSIPLGLVRASVRLCFWFFELPASIRLCFWFFVEFEGRSCSTRRMPRQPRIEFEGAIYQVMARGNDSASFATTTTVNGCSMTCAARCYAAAGNCSPSSSWRTTCTCSSRRLAPILRGACSNSSRRMPSGTDDDIVESGTCSRDGTGPNSSRMRATIGPSAGISTSIRSVLGSSSARTHGGGRAIPAMPSRPTACPGCPTRPCCRPGVASTVEPIQRVPTGASWRQV